MMTPTKPGAVWVAVALTIAAATAGGAQTTASARTGNAPAPSPTLGHAPPAMDDRTVVLFDGGDWSRWRGLDGSPSGWEVQEDASVLVRGGNAVTARTFGDFQLHLEFLCPEMPGKTGQGRANSGVYLHGRYEVQVLDTWGLEPHESSCAALYSIAPPLVNACRPPGNWQTYDIVFRAPRFTDDGAVETPASVTVIQNGIVVHNNLPLPHTTPGGLDDEVVATGPLLLQDHGDPIRYRNIWIRELEPAGERAR